MLGAVGQLFVLFGVKTNFDEFAAATGALKALRAAAVVTGIGRLGQGIAHVAQNAGNAGIHIKSLSQQMGMTSQQTQEWGYIAEQAGSNVDELSIGIVRLSKNMRALDQGRNTIGTRALKALGITREMSHAALSDPAKFQDVLFKISAAFLHMGNTAQRAGISNEVFGRQAKSVVSDLARGPVELKKLIDAINSRGAIISNQNIDNLAHFGNRIHNIKQELRAFAYDAIAKVSPLLLEMLDAATKWIATNKDLISGALLAGLKLLEISLQIIATLITTIADVWRGFTEGEFGPVVIVLAIAYAISKALIPALIRMAIASTLALAPLIGMAAIVAVIILIAKLISMIDFDVIREKLVAFGRWVGGVFEQMGRGFVIIGKAIGKGILDALKVVGEFIQSTGDRIYDAIANALHRAAEKAREFIQKIANSFRSIGRAISDFFTGRDSDSEATNRGATLSGLSQETSQMLGQSPVFAAMFKARALENPVGAAPAGSTAAVVAGAIPGAGTRGPTSVSVGPTTININGVKDAAQAKDSIADSMDGVHRHAAAALGGEVQ